MIPYLKTMEKDMSKSIIVTTSGKDGFKVMVNFIQRGVIYHSSTLANQEATKLGIKENIDNIRLIKES